MLRELGQRGVPVLGVGKPDSIGRASRHAGAFAVRPAGAIGDWLPGMIAAHGAGAVMAVSEARGVGIAVPASWQPLAG